MYELKKLFKNEAEIIECDEDTEEIIIPSKINGNVIVGIADCAFFGCKNLTSIIIPNSVKYIGPGAFSGCSNLEEIVIPESVETIYSSAFYKTKWLTNKQKENPFVIVNGNLLNAEKCEHDCIIPEGVKIIREGSFDGADPYVVYIPESIESIEDFVFSECNNIQKFIVSPKSKHYHAVDGVLFNDKTLIRYPVGNTQKSYTISPFDTDNIGRFAFHNAKYLENIDITYINTIGIGAFYDCRNLKNITIDECDVISNQAFYKCESLQEIKIPESTRVIGHSAFYGCKSLDKVIIDGNPQIQIEDDAFWGCPAFT